MTEKPRAGTILWHDLTVRDAPGIRDFYQAVVGWEPSDVVVEDHTDFNMTVPGGTHPEAGICHAMGVNKDIPPQWMIYIVVDDLEKSVAAVERLGGSVLVPAHEGGHRMAIIRDPAGAVAALYQL